MPACRDSSSSVAAGLASSLPGSQDGNQPFPPLLPPLLSSAKEILSKEILQFLPCTQLSDVWISCLNCFTSL